MKPSYLKIILSLVVATYCYSIALHPAESYFIDSINLIFHEAGHTLAFWLPQFLYILAGSAFQVVVPLVCTGYFFIRREFYSASLVLFWVGQSIINVSVYAGDAVAQQLPLLGGGSDSTIHDWYYLLSTTGLLEYTSLIAGLIYIAGMVTITIAVCWGSKICVDELQPKDTTSF